MQYNYYSYEKSECDLKINKMPIWFREVKCEGDRDKGIIIFNTQDEYDEIYGPNAKMEIEWEKKERMALFHAKEVQKSIDIYNAIGLVIISKQDSWLNTHEFTTWEGYRTKMMRKRYYRENNIHCVFYCDISERIINVHVDIIDKYYDNFKPFITKAFSTLVCHE